MPAKLKLSYALVEQIVGLKRDGLCDADIIAAIGVRTVRVTDSHSTMR